jgi:hypothetical protein
MLAASMPATFVREVDRLATLDWAPSLALAALCSRPNSVF